MDTTYKIRRLAKLDEPFLWEMLYQALYVAEGQPPLPRETIHEPLIRRYVENWGLPDDAGWVATHGDLPIGAAWLRQFSEENKGFGTIDPMTPEISIALSPGYRGKGIGSALLDHLFEFAKEHYACISLSVCRENPARRLYDRTGFQIVKQEGESLTMVKYLKDQKQNDK